MNNQDIENLASIGAKAPRVSLAQVESVIVGETYTRTPSGKALICELTLKNGFTVRGESSVVSLENYVEEKGRTISRARAVAQVWMLEGYLLQELIHCKNTTGG